MFFFFGGGGISGYKYIYFDLCPNWQFNLIQSVKFLKFTIKSAEDFVVVLSENLPIIQSPALVPGLLTVTERRHCGEFQEKQRDAETELWWSLSRQTGPPPPRMPPTSELSLTDSHMTSSIVFSTLSPSLPPSVLDKCFIIRLNFYLQYIVVLFWLGWLFASYY